MFVVMNRISVNPAFAEAFEERFRHRAGEVDKMPGFIRNLVLRPVGPDDPYVVMTMWESKQMFEAWTQSDAFRKGHARSGTLPADAFRGPSRLEMFDAFVDSAAG
jgi:heme oxygenase (mycobilin-producing)